MITAARFYSGNEAMRIPALCATAGRLGCALLLSVASAQAGAAALVWNSGLWGDTWQSQPTSANDSDGDGWANAKDSFPADNAEWGDADGDGIGDNADIDDDNDGLFDYPDPDDDNDGLSDLAENSLGTNPLLADTDGDGLGDGDEVNDGRNPLVNEGAIILLINSE